MAQRTSALIKTIAQTRANIVDFVTIYNEAQRQLKELSNSSIGGELAG